MSQLLKKITEREWIEKKEKHFNEMKKSLAKIPCLAHFTKDWDKIVTIGESRGG